MTGPNFIDLTFIGENFGASFDALGMNAYGLDVGAKPGDLCCKL